MNNNRQLYEVLSDSQVLEQLYGFAYQRCNCTQDAEDLCSSIIIEVLKCTSDTIQDQKAYVWGIAYRVYADFAKDRSRYHERYVMLEEETLIVSDDIEEIENRLEQQRTLKRIRREISFLAKIYREIMILYYLEEKKVSVIAEQLGLSPTNVKQKLFTARNIVRKEVKKMNTEVCALKPVAMSWHGDGNPLVSYPRRNAMRVLSQNLLYLCRKQARSLKELSELLDVPMVFIEDEVNIQCYGTNGRDGFLKKTEDGKYISTFIMLDIKEYEQVQMVIRDGMADYMVHMKTYLKKIESQILSLPYLNPPKDISYVLWCMMSSMCIGIGDSLCDAIKQKYYPEVKLPYKDYYDCAIVYPWGEVPEVKGYGVDGIVGEQICGYSKVHICNVYGKQLDAHFHCDCNISMDPKLMLMIRSIGGLCIQDLTEAEKETASKAIQEGYLMKQGDCLYPNIIVLPMECRNLVNQIEYNFSLEMREFAESIADQVYPYVKKFLPKHLVNEVEKFIVFCTYGIETKIIDQCVDEKILCKPKDKLSGAGTYMYVEKEQ